MKRKILASLLLTFTAFFGAYAQSCNANLALNADSSDCQTMNYSVSGWSYSSIWWDFGDGNYSNNSTSGAHTYTSNGIYNVEVVVYNYDSLGNYICGDTINQAYTVNCSGNTGVNCNATMSLYSDSANCWDMNYYVSGGPYSNIWWDFGDGNYSNNNASGTHTYASNGVYNVEVVVYNYDSLGNYICGDTINQTYTVNCTGNTGVNCNATMSLYSDSANCWDMNYYVSGGSYTNIWWDFGDGNYSNNNTSGTHSYASSGIYNVEVVVYNYDSLGNYICGDTINQSYTVNCVLGLEENGVQLETSVYPSPLNSGDVLNVLISSNANETISVQLMSIVGQVISDNELQLVEGDNKMSIPTSGLPSGIYLLSINDLEGNLKTQRVIVE